MRKTLGSPLGRPLGKTLGNNLEDLGNILGTLVLWENLGKDFGEKIWKDFGKKSGRLWENKINILPIDDDAASGIFPNKVLVIWNRVVIFPRGWCSGKGV